MIEPRAHSRSRHVWMGVVPGTAAALLFGASACTLLVSTTGLAGGDPVDGGADTTPPDATRPQDAVADVATEAAPPPPCQLEAPFPAPIMVPGLESVNGYGPRLSADEMTIYFQTTPVNSTDVVAATRTSTTAAFGAYVVLNGVSTGASDGNPMVSLDGLSLYFTSDRGGSTAFDLYRATRASEQAVFANPTVITKLISPTNDSEPYFTAGVLYFASARKGSMDIFAARPSGDSFDEPVSVAELNGSSDDRMPVVTADALTIYFASNRGAGGKHAPWVAHRPTVAAPFSAPTPVSELAGQEQLPSWVSPDGCRLYLSGPNEKFYVTTKPK